ncbi:hypothetical protein EYF80_052470 [Liparis tanakae]|uniref:Uncharacterized protein n=1 Tax=Liparis tanakae TaxID=230148 RepID=A0A4Z2F971_9TELE|nr:hypothetical protein EYF80_052470 [Liparis tanakae]
MLSETLGKSGPEFGFRGASRKVKRSDEEGQRPVTERQLDESCLGFSACPPGDLTAAALPGRRRGANPLAPPQVNTGISAVTFGNNAGGQLELAQGKGGQNETERETHDFVANSQSPSDMRRFIDVSARIPFPSSKGIAASRGLPSVGTGNSSDYLARVPPCLQPSKASQQQVLGIKISVVSFRLWGLIG